MGGLSYIKDLSDGSDGLSYIKDLLEMGDGRWGRYIKVTFTISYLVAAEGI